MSISCVLIFACPSEMAAILEYEMQMNSASPAVIAVFGKCGGDLAHCVVSTLFVPSYEVRILAHD